jgi:hypothetical protein
VFVEKMYIYNVFLWIYLTDGVLELLFRVRCCLRVSDVVVSGRRCDAN